MTSKFTSVDKPQFFDQEVQKVKLSAIAEVIRGVTFSGSDAQKNFFENSMGILRAGNIQEELVVDNDLIFVDRSFVKNNQIMKKDDIVMCASSGSVDLVGKSCLVPNDTNLSIGGFCLLIRPKKEVCDPKFLNYFFKSNLFKKWTSNSSGANIKNIRKAELEKYELDLPSRARQKELGNKLFLVDELIKSRKLVLSNLDKLVKSQFVEMFGSIANGKFPQTSLGIYATIKHGFAFDGEFFTHEDNGVLLLTPGNFCVGGGYQEKRVKFFTGNFSKEYVLKPGQMIVTMTDLSKACDTLGSTLVLPETRPFYLHNQRIGLINLDPMLNKTFLTYLMNSDEFRLKIVQTATGSTVKHTSPKRILDSLIMLPPIELQIQFEVFVEKINKSKFAVEESICKLELLKKSLMQQYFG